MANTQQQNKINGKFIASLPLGLRVAVRNTTTSMVPAIRPGQEVRITRVPAARITEGEVIAFTKGKRRNIIVHRVIRIIHDASGILFQTKGDNVPHPDRYTVLEEDLIGKVDFR